MKEIKMVDLGGQYQKIKPEIDATIMNVLSSTAFVNGPEVAAFKKELAEYLGVKHVLPCANGTDALQIALMALGLKPGDEVISVDFTFAATVEVLGLLQLKPVLIDVNSDTFTMDVNQLEKAITPKTKAIIPVHLYGQTADMEPIMNLARKNNIAVVEDTAQAIGSEYEFSDGTVKKSGTIGTIGTTSFFPSKNLGAYGDGGAMFTNDDDLANRISAITNHGMYERYYHEEIGVNSRLDSLQAAILRIKLKHLDEYSAQRGNAAAYYDEAFKNCKNILTPARAKNSSHVFHQYTLRLKGVDRDLVKEKLSEKGIPAMIYYPVPLHLQKAYQNYEFDTNQLPVSKQLSKEVISLPMHTELDEEQLKYIADSVIEIVNSLK